MESNSVCNHTSDNKIGRPAQRESDLFITSMIRLIQVDLNYKFECDLLI